MKVFVAILFLSLSSVASADHCRVRQNAVVVQDFAAVQFAVPIGVPVAQVTPAFYSYNATAQTYRPQVQAQSDDAKLFEEFLTWKKAREVSVRATGVETAVFKACSKCHAGPSPKVGFGILGDLTDADRIKAIGEVITGRMPKGGKLSPEEVGKVLGELSGAKDKPAAAVSPQVQGESK